jgi:hypothetical protein
MSTYRRSRNPNAKSTSPAPLCPGAFGESNSTPGGTWENWSIFCAWSKPRVNQDNCAGDNTARSRGTLSHDQLIRQKELPNGSSVLSQTQIAQEQPQGLYIERSSAGAQACAQEPTYIRVSAFRKSTAPAWRANRVIPGSPRTAARVDLAKYPS